VEGVANNNKMADSDFDDSFESSSDCCDSDARDNPYDIQLSQVHHVAKSDTIKSSEFEMSEEISSPKAFQRISSPKSSPLNRKKFLPNFKKPGGLGNITLENLIKKKKKKMFGVSLQTAVYRSQLGSDGIELPTIFRQCIDYLEENSLEHEGIYRLAGVKSQIDAVKTLYDKGT
jgi:RalA-binding protein 1